VRLCRLLWRELRFRAGNSLLSLLAVAVGVAVATGAVLRLRWQEADTARFLAASQAEADKILADLEEEMREITKNLGFNVLILPNDQNLADFYANDFAAKTMPEDYVHVLARSKIITVQHLLPILQRKMVWEEKQRTVLLIGVHGEVPIQEAPLLTPLTQPVPAGHIVLGYEQHAGEGIRVGDTVTFLGQAYTVHETKAQQGNKDDITVWIPLADMQRRLGLEGRINAILALQCKCAWADVAKIRKEIGGILPGTQVIEFSTQALARAEARNQAAETRQKVIAQQQAGRVALLREQGRHASVLVPLVSVGAMALLASLTYFNARDRRSEVGILRAMGLSRARILAVFLGKAAVLGVGGAVFGLAGGIVLSILLHEGGGLPWTAGLDPLSLGVAGVCAPLLMMLSAWPPSAWAAAQDPAALLHED
jgi:putative ABC transport system permease protein